MISYEDYIAARRADDVTYPLRNLYVSPGWIKLFGPKSDDSASSVVAGGRASIRYLDRLYGKRDSYGCGPVMMVLGKPWSDGAGYTHTQDTGEWAIGRSQS